MSDPNTREIRKGDVVIRKGAPQPRGIVIVRPFTLTDADLRGLRAAPLDAGQYALVMWHNRKRAVAELTEDLEPVRSLDADW